MGLGGKRGKFIDEYAKRGFKDAEEAAKVAGYKDTGNTYGIVKKILDDPDVAEEIQRLKEEMEREENEYRTLERANPNAAYKQKVIKLWVEVMEDDNQSMETRLKASDKVAKVIGAFDKDSGGMEDIIPIVIVDDVDGK